MKDVNLKPKNVILRPRITEKSAISSEKGNVYVFEVTPDATKHSIKMSVREIYKVTPEKVRVTAIPKKRVFVRGTRGTTGGGKKAYVYLKSVDKIEVV